jgi:hypothetical protein
MDLLACRKQFLCTAKLKVELFIDDVMPDGI